MASETLHIYHWEKDKSIRAISHNTSNMLDDKNINIKK